MSYRCFNKSFELNINSFSPPEGAFEGEGEQEEDGDERVAACAELFLLAAQHHAQQGEEGHYDHQRYGRAPEVLGQWYAESQGKSHKEGVDAHGHAEQQSGAVAAYVVWLDGTFLFSAAEEQAQCHENHQSEIDQVVGVGQQAVGAGGVGVELGRGEAQQVAQPDAEQQQQCVDGGYGYRFGQALCEADGGFEGAAVHYYHRLEREGDCENYEFDY